MRQDCALRVFGDLAEAAASRPNHGARCRRPPGRRSLAESLLSLQAVDKTPGCRRGGRDIRPRSVGPRRAPRRCRRRAPATAAKRLPSRSNASSVFPDLVGVVGSASAEDSVDGLPSTPGPNASSGTHNVSDAQRSPRGKTLEAGYEPGWGNRNGSGDRKQGHPRRRGARRPAAPLRWPRRWRRSSPAASGSAATAPSPAIA